MSEEFEVVSDQPDPTTTTYIDILIKHKERLEKQLEKAIDIEGEIEQRKLVSTNPLERTRQEQDIEHIKKQCEELERRIKELESKINTFRHNLTVKAGSLDRQLETAGWQNLVLDDDQELSSREARYKTLRELDLLNERVEVLVRNSKPGGSKAMGRYSPQHYRARLEQGIKALDFVLAEIELDNADLAQLQEDIARAERKLNNSY